MSSVRRVRGGGFSRAAFGGGAMPRRRACARVCGARAVAPLSRARESGTWTIVTQKRWSGDLAGSATHLRLRHGGVLRVYGHDAASGEPRGRGASRPERGAERVASPAERRLSDRRANPRGVVARRGKVPATGGGREAHRGRRHGDVRVDEAKQGSTEQSVQKAGADVTTYVAARAGRCVRAFHDHGSRTGFREMRKRFSREKRRYYDSSGLTRQSRV